MISFGMGFYILTIFVFEAISFYFMYKFMKELDKGEAKRV
jgi:hypothetical protein